MNALQSEFTTSLAAADASLLQTNVLLQLMEKSQEVRRRSSSRKRKTTEARGRAAPGGAIHGEELCTMPGGCPGRGGGD